MKSIATFILVTGLGLSAAAQTTITNGGFENWGNASPGLASEPTSWYSNKSGSSIAAAGPQTCFKDSIDHHSGSYSVKMVTESYIGTAVNGVVTTAVVNAPSITKTDGYIGTVNYSSASDDRRMPFIGRPDSITGWYQYTSGGAAEQAKVRVILHTGDYYDPETPTTYHPDDTANRIADVTFLGSTSNVTSWTRFSLPFTYYKTIVPAYVMINATPSANQGTTITGSTLILDDLAVVYAPPANLAVSSITTTSAVLNWTEPGISTAGSEYVVSTTAGAPTGSGTLIAGLTHTATGLTPGTTYYASVRDSCISGAFSNWVTVPFTTLGASGVKNVTNNDFSITAYPNPVGDELTVKINGTINANGKVELMDASGKLIKTIAAGSSMLTINMNGLSSGIYLIRYVDSEHVQTIKINKE
jgi:hypothetical protein